MTASIRDAARPFTGGTLTALLPRTTRLLGLGEPTHGVEAFPELRNEIFRHLVEHEGYRSIAMESDCLAALTADAYVTDGTGTLDDAMRHGFSHGLGASPANRELVRWMRAYNEQRPPQERLHFHGFDGPLEMTGAASPRPALTALHDYLSAHLDLAWSRETLDELFGPDERWTNPAVTTDPTQSVGRTPEAKELRLVVDDLRTLLTAHTPHLTAATSPDGWWRADLYARTAAGLLRYHAGMADTAPTRVGTLMCLRDAMMADNLGAIVGREARRGPTLAFAHNRHLQKDRSRWLLPEGWGPLAGRTLEWWSAGAIVGTRLGEQYAFAATTFGTRGSDVPQPDTLEGRLSALPDTRAVIDPVRLAAVLDRKPTPRVPTDHTYLPLDPATTDQTDAIIFVKEI
ncbi:MULTISPECIES: erythromycin esterase family protein [Streptosporangium]|uniref:Erythromycin esterase-like protein n=1 Tax=Streptosporangium brasiliense TaxID=47480 RepID=A0ABT9RI06_9ACTN|nr:erythromycin esterase family protein [Streptosporangium brasiliense]MDP9868354.1 erythromycin esterase-like protein [Streptosporangium brasiliense]